MAQVHMLAELTLEVPVDSPNVQPVKRAGLEIMAVCACQSKP